MSKGVCARSFLHWHFSNHFATFSVLKGNAHRFSYFEKKIVNLTVPVRRIYEHLSFWTESDNVNNFSVLQWFVHRNFCCQSICVSFSVLFINHSLGTFFFCSFSIQFLRINSNDSEIKPNTKRRTRTHMCIHFKNSWYCQHMLI